MNQEQLKQLRNTLIVLICLLSINVMAIVYNDRWMEQVIPFDIVLIGFIVGIYKVKNGKKNNKRLEIPLTEVYKE